MIIRLLADELIHHFAFTHENICNFDACDNSQVIACEEHVYLADCLLLISCMTGIDRDAKKRDNRRYTWTFNRLSLTFAHDDWFFFAVSNLIIRTKHEVFQLLVYISYRLTAVLSHAWNHYRIDMLRSSNVLTEQPLWQLSTCNNRYIRCCI